MRKRKRKAIIVDRHDLKCDAPGCSFIELGVAVSEELIGRPCPICGASLLTREDYQAMRDTMSAIGLINKVFVVPDNAPGGYGQPVSINPHAGDINITIKGGS